jgi:peroxiredoxin
MEQAIHLFEKLSRCTEDAPEWQELYDDFTSRLNSLSVGKRAPAIGSKFPSVALPNHLGQYRDVGDLYKSGPLVISFNRGSWCPYCVHELESWRDSLAALGGVGGKLVVIAGEISGRGDALADIFNDEVEILCDVEHGAALSLGLAFHAGDELLRRYVECGLDLSDIYGTQSGILPIPATFVLDQDGIVRYAFVDPDFRVRAEPQKVIAVVEALAN